MERTKSNRSPFILASVMMLALIVFAVFYFTQGISDKSISPPHTPTNGSGKLIEGSVTISPADAIKANVSVVKISMRELSRDIEVIGKIRIAEPSQTVVSARARGRIEKLHVSATGKVIRKGDALYDFYSPEILNAEQEYLISWRSHSSEKKNPGDHMHGTLDEGLIQAGKERLKLFGLSADQITELEKQAVPQNTITIHSPASGIVLQKPIQEGAYVDEGTLLFQLADLSVVWAEFEVSENDIRYIHEGIPLSIRASSYLGESFEGRVIFISPVENPQSRSVTVRLSLPNPKGRLRPEMFVSAEIHIPLVRSLAIPESAVTRTGKRDYVWVRNGDGSFSDKDVELGALSSDHYYQVLSGISEGEVIAASGSFLIDSEHQFAQGANPMAGMNMDAGDQSSKSSGDGTGTVRGMDAKRQTITLDHGNIAGVMAAMTMAYKAKTPAMLENVKSGDHVKFTLSRSESGEYIISSIKPE
ncbi:MAG: efflux RND transporter periplasmic adaptor subunit [Ignavibacteriota bacterium]